MAANAAVAAVVLAAGLPVAANAEMAAAVVGIAAAADVPMATIMVDIATAIAAKISCFF
jgi:hypothetical protein